MTHTSPSPGFSGLLLIDKPEGLTSHDVVDEVREILGTQRIGHTGTLDPAATGLLVLCVGRSAGRLQSFLTGLDKSYEGEMRFGIETDTYDREGTQVGATHPEPFPEREAVLSAAAAYTGEFEQSPPPFSAKKFGGKKFYELARKGEAVPVTSKRVRVDRFAIRGLAGDRADFDVVCTSGTYIRSLVHEVGKIVGMGAHLTQLRRTSIGRFQLEDAITLEALRARPEESRLTKPHWIPTSEIPLPFPSVALAVLEAEKVRRGQAVPVRLPSEVSPSSWIRLTTGGHLLALGLLEPLGRGTVALARPKIVLSD
ncbi:MAG: tRNA pseudouridine(55) synthase TruB [Acidobacteria bacterium]|nr:tRNA pseudouridine(55) synthase TruB [Acidobacteriota bacterium]MCG3193596.1 tRNA pseudouridine synthase B [Thermoanaerobaculia bacterium]MCK6684368.1 tRNA pseudouridine(55) synthase TruB [Thermoanaerobaculia bacterium]